LSHTSCLRLLTFLEKNNLHREKNSRTEEGGGECRWRGGKTSNVLWHITMVDDSYFKITKERILTASNTKK
jgi:hypothetical protein